MTILFLARIEIKKLLLFNKKFNYFVSHPTFIDKSEGFVAYLAAIQLFNERFKKKFNFRVYLLNLWKLILQTIVFLIFKIHSLKYDINFQRKRKRKLELLANVLFLLKNLKTLTDIMD